VRAVMKSTTGGMTDMFRTFTTTGKMDFRSFAASVAQTAAQMMADRAILAFLKIGMGFFGGTVAYSGSGGMGLDGGLGTSTAGFNYTPSFGNPYAVVPNAMGGVMTRYGSVPLRRYDAGGIARSPQLALYGEGKIPEAYVPLPDGRSIPVTMSGGMGGNTQVSIAIHVDSDGGSRVESDGSGEKAAQLGRMIENATMAVIAREKRAGGLLYT